MVLSSSAQATRNHAVHMRTNSSGWLRLLSTTEAGTVSVQCLDVLLLETVNAYQPGQVCQTQKQNLPHGRCELASSTQLGLRACAGSK